MNQVRAFRSSDIDAVVALHRATFTRQGKPGSGGADLVAYYGDFLLQNPWRDPECGSLVFESDGQILAFLGVTPRPFTFRGRPIRAAIATNFMAAPGSARAGIGAAAIVRKLLEGPHDLSLCDGTADVRAMWEPLGAIATSITALRWRLPLRPTLLVARQLRRAGRRDIWRPNRLTMTVADALDPLMRRSAGLPVRLSRTAATTYPLTTEQLSELIASVATRYAVAPVYDATHLDWLADYITSHSDRGALQMSAVSRGDRVIGWFVMQLDRGRSATVLQIGAIDGPLSVVVAELLRTCASSSAAYVEGHLDPEVLHAYGGQMFCRQPGWKLAAARDRDLLFAIATGDAFLSPLDGDPLS